MYIIQCDIEEQGFVHNINIYVTCLMKFQIIHLCYILSTVMVYSTGRVELWNDFEVRHSRCVIQIS